jgi:phosphoribosylglycinamide formyltransferase-1
MSIATQPLISSFLGVNVHPADLTILNEDGKRKYTGDEAVLNAILAREKYIRSTTHVVEHEVDGGKILMVSAPVEVVLPKNFDYKNKESLKKIADGHQSRLKEAGDWKIFPRTLELISQGRFARDNWNQGLYFDGKPVQNGIRFEDLR